MSAPVSLLFPIETINRELDWRLALAVQAASPKNRIFLGLHSTLMRLTRHLRGGVYLGKEAIRPHVPGALKDYRRLKDRGFLLVHFDTEGAIFPGGEDRWREILLSRLDPRHLDREDHILTWGHFQQEVYAGVRPDLSDHIHATGHPRFDLYRRRWRSYYDDDTRRLRARFGDFLLINTNLARANNKMGLSFVFSPFNGYRADDLVSRVRSVQEWAYKNHQLSHFVRLVHRLHVVYPEIPIVVRPHPSEDPRFYELVFQGMPSVHVLHEGPVAPWLFATRCMIHDGCTTGLEAHLGEVPTMNFCPVEDNSQDLFLPNLFGVRCTSEDEVVEALVELFAEGPPRTRFDDPRLVDHRARRLLRNFSAPAFPAVLEVLRQAQEQVADRQSCSTLRLGATELVAETLEGIKHRLRPLSSKHRQAAEYGRAKFPGLDAGDVGERIRRLERLLDKSVGFQVISRGLMVVQG